jgi:hypothetical protein
MTAQFILIDHRPSGKAAGGAAGTKSQAKKLSPKKSKSGAKPKTEDKVPEFPEFRPLPIGYAVYGQLPKRLGHFETIPSLVKSLRASKKLPGGSNTVFATVRDIKGLKSKSFRAGLAKLPDELTIVVRPGEPDAQRR